MASRVVMTQPLMDDGSLGWVSDVLAIAAQILPSLISGGGAKKNYETMDKAAISLVDSYGVDIVTTSKMMGVDPNQVVKALSEYLMTDFKITLPPERIIADQDKKYPQAAMINSNMTPIILGGGGLLLLILLMRKK